MYHYDVKNNDSQKKAKTILFMGIKFTDCCMDKPYNQNWTDHWTGSISYVHQLPSKIKSNLNL